MLNRLIKLNAKRALGNSWSKAIAQVLILNGTSLLFMLTAILSYTMFCYPVSPEQIKNPPIIATVAIFLIFVIYFLVISPLKIGIKMWFLSLSGGKCDEDMALCFEGFSSFKIASKSILLSLSLSVKKLLIYALFSFIPISITAYGINYIYISQTVRESFLSISCTICGICLLILSLISAYFFCLRYFVVPYAFISDDCKNVRKAFKTSKEATKDYKGSLFILNLSLIFHYICNSFVITALYTYPYTQSVRALYSRYLLENYKNNSQPEKEKTEQEQSENQETKQEP